MCISCNKFILGRVWNDIWKMFKGICFYCSRNILCVQISVGFFCPQQFFFFIYYFVFLEIYNPFTKISILYSLSPKKLNAPDLPEVHMYITHHPLCSSCTFITSCCGRCRDSRACCSTPGQSAGITRPVSTQWKHVLQKITRVLLMIKLKPCWIRSSQYKMDRAASTWKL